MLVTFGPNVSNLPDPLSKGLLDGVPDRFITSVKNLNKLKELQMIFFVGQQPTSLRFTSITSIKKQSAFLADIY